MGYGQLVYRRSSGIYVARLTVPAQFRDRLGRRELHVSTGQRSRHAALSTASAVAQFWRALFSDLARLDALKVVEGSALLSGAGIISLAGAAAALGMEPLALATELANRGSALMAMADGWNAVDVPDLRHVDREDGAYLWDSLEDQGQSCRVYGLVTLRDALNKILEFHGAGRIAAWNVLVHNRQSTGEVFVAPNTAWIGLADLLVQKAEVEALRVSAAALIAAAKAGAAPPQAPAVPVVIPATEQIVGSGVAPTASASHATQTLGSMPPSASEMSSVLGTPARDQPSFPVATTRVSDGSHGSLAGGRHAAMRSTALIEAFIKAKSSPDVGSTTAAWKRDETLRTRQKLRCFPEFMGDLTMADLELMPEAEDIVRNYVQRLMTLPTGPALTKARIALPEGTAPALAAWATENGVETMSAQTAQNYRSKLAECFKWGIERTYLKANPAAGISGDGKLVKQRPDADRNRFSDSELNTIFAMHWFRHGRGKDTISGKPGRHYRPFYYWLPLLALHTGGRANELGQLYLSDICDTDGGIPYIAFRLDQPDKLDVDDADVEEASSGTNGAKSLKTVNSERSIPIHSTLLRLGLLEYVSALRSEGHKRLFPELRFDKTKGYGLEARKWFNERLLGRKLSIPRDGTKTLHSLRHNFSSVVEKSGARHRVQSQLLGHQRGETLAQRRYTDDENADELRGDLEKLLFVLPQIAPFDVPAGLQSVSYALLLKRSRAKQSPRKNSVELAGIK